MPQLRREAAGQLQACTERLVELPQAITTDPTSYVLSLVTTFCHDVKLHIDGDSSFASLVQKNRIAYENFKHDIRSTAPPFLPVSSASQSRNRTLDWQLVDEDSDEDDDPEMSMSTSRKGDDGPPATTTRVITLQNVRTLIRRSLGRELPGNVPYRAKVSLIRDFQTSWEMDSQECFDAVLKNFEKDLFRLVGKRFDRYETLKVLIVSV